MKVTCPACSATGNIDESRLPPEGRDITCPRCRQRFRQMPERSAVEIIQQRSTMVCPKCNTEQPVSETCNSCGIVVQKYIRSVARARDLERLELAKLKSDLHRVDSWYTDLFDRRLVSLVSRILSLLVIISLFMTCSFNNARRSRLMVENAVQQRLAEAPTRSKPDDGKILADLYNFESKAKDAINQCLSQCDRYAIAWYNNAEPGVYMYREHCLDSNMSDQLEALKALKHTVDADFDMIRMPSQPYQPYYIKVKGLHNVFQSFYQLATTPETHYYDFHAQVSRNDGDYRRIVAEIEEIRPKQIASP